MGFKPIPGTKIKQVKKLLTTELHGGNTEENTNLYCHKFRFNLIMIFKSEIIRIKYDTCPVIDRY